MDKKTVYSKVLFSVISASMAPDEQVFLTK